MADPLIKSDPETQGASPGLFSEDDIYEDAGDLEFNTDPDFQRLYLARVPKFLWEAWSKLDDDAEIHIGTIRQVTVTDQNGEQSVYISFPAVTSKLTPFIRLPFRCYCRHSSPSIKWFPRSMS